MRRDILCVLADEHAGSDVGLLNPETILEKDEFGQIVKYNPQLTPYQELLWACHDDHLKSVIRIADGDNIILIHNGDLTKGNVYPSNSLGSRMADQIIMGYYNLRTWMEFPNVSTLRLAKGTGVHVFGEGSSEILVAKMLKNEFFDKDIGVVYHGLLDIGGLKVDYAHHGPFPGSRDWLMGNVAQLYLRSVMTRMLKRGVTPPDLFLFAHYHTYVRVVQVVQWGDREYESMLVICPSYCGPDEHTIKAVRSLDSISNGLVVFELLDGKIHTVVPLLETTDLRIRDTL